MIRTVTLLALLLSTPAFAQPVPPISERALTLDSGGVELRGALSIFGFSTTGEKTDTFALGGVGASFGLSDMVEIGGDYAFEASPDTDAAGELAGHVQIRLAHGGPLDASLGAAVLYSHSVDGIVLGGGLNVRYRLSKEVSLYSMTSGIPVCGGCLRVLGPVTGQFLVGVPSHGDTEVLLNLPVGIGIQATPQLYLFGETSLATIALTPKFASISTISDYVGINAGAWLSAGGGFEIGGSVADELEHAGDIFLVELMARVRM